MKPSILAIAAAAVCAVCVAVPAGAVTMPKPATLAATDAANVTQVAWRCGRGWHWSWRYRRCVPNWRRWR